MKKRLLAIVALLVAFVMSFALIACGDKVSNDKKEEDKVPQLTAAKLQSAIDKIQNAKTLELDISTYATSKSTDKANEYEAKVTVSGNRGKYTDPATGLSYVFDLDTGYIYTELDEGGYAFDQMLPSGFFDYVDDVMTTATGDSNVEIDYTEMIKQFDYDKTYGGFVAKVQAEDDVNAVLEFAQNAYKNDDTLNDVVDSILQKLTGEPTFTLEAILDLLCGDGYNLIKAMPLSALLGEDADELFDELFAALEEAGMTLDAAQKAAVKNRKVGELAAGAMEVFDAMMSDEQYSPDPEEIFTALFFTEYSAAEIDAVGTMLATYSDMLIDFLKNAKFRTYVDKAPADVKTMIATDGFRFQSIEASFGFKFDGDEISEIAIGGYIEHNYDGNVSVEMEFLNDNNYDASVTIGFTVKNTEESFDVTFADEEYHAYVTAIVKGYSDEDAVVYLETAGKEIAVSNITVYGRGIEGGLVEVDGANVTYDAASSSFVIDNETIAKLVESDCDGYKFMVTYDLTVDDAEDRGVLFLLVAPDAQSETLLDMIGSL